MLKICHLQIPMINLLSNPTELRLLHFLRNMIIPQQNTGETELFKTKPE